MTTKKKASAKSATKKSAVGAKTGTKAGTKTKTKAATKTDQNSTFPKIEPDNKHVVIRMYNIGFGDCFLILIPTSQGVKKVLIDCGVHASGTNPASSVDQVVKQVITDVTDDDGIPRIDIVVATHRHRDHVSGFAKPDWEAVEVGEVWMPWTENYQDPEAVAILKKQSTAGKKLSEALQLMIANPKRFGFKQEALSGLNAIKDFSENSLTNLDAMNTLHYGFKGGKNIRRQYLPFKDRKQNKMSPERLPGVKVFFMGPSRDQAVIRDMDPSGDEQWFRLVNETASNSKSSRLPFHEGWAKKLEDSDLANYAQTTDELNALKSVLSKMRNIGEGTELSLAVSLEKAVNGTSLMMMFQVGKAYLLFPGDAQNGTWQMALQDEEWRELLMKTNFYKVGHHGSHNATPKEFVFDILQPRFRAMASVYPVKAWKYIPKSELMTSLINKPGDIVRSDQQFDGQPDPPSFTRTMRYVETKIPVN